LSNSIIMLRTCFQTISIAIFIIIIANACYAQDTLGHSADTLKSRSPKALLVQLRSEHNRMEALIKQHRYKEIEGLKTDAMNVTARMISDFHDNFNYCPVYYYMDTNMDLIKNRVFQGVLLHEDLTPIENVSIPDSDYLIAFYGYPTSQSRTSNIVKDSTYRIVYSDTSDIVKGIMDTMTYNYNSGEPIGKGLIINNNKFKQVSFLYKLDYENLMFKLRRANKKYIYVSKRYEIEYFPFATLLNAKLIDRDEKIRITHHRGEKVDYKPVPQTGK